jgi:hypothetical protein
MTTLIPSDNRALLIPRPMPLAPPVTNAVLPEKFLTQPTLLSGRRRLLFRNNGARSGLDAK